MVVGDAKRFAYVTLITRASYLAGVVILAHSLKKRGSEYPLIVLYTPNLAEHAVKALEQEAPKTNILLHKCDYLLPPNGIKRDGYIAERFIDTWTKLRVFELRGYDAVCYLDADMAIFKNMDAVFDNASQLPDDWIAANHTCVCNLDHDPWAPSDWRPENCAYTPLQHPDALAHPTQPVPGGMPTHHDLNGGMFLFHPSPELWDSMLDFFNTSPLLATFKFPDQDFLAHFFRHKWRALGWQYNAIKTLAYTHPSIWRDEEVVCLHYIVDKPWTKRVNTDGTAGFKGKDGTTHGWWWAVYEEWEGERAADWNQGLETMVLVRKGVAKPKDVVGGARSAIDDDPDMRAIGSDVQGFANNKVAEEDSNGLGAKEQPTKGRDDASNSAGGPHGPVLRNPMLGERGHGPVVNPRGSSRMVQ